MSQTRRASATRIRTAGEARKAAWILPPPDRLPEPGRVHHDLALERGRRYGVSQTTIRAFLVDDSNDPHVVADFVVELVAARTGGKLVEWTRTTKGRLSRWVLWGTLVETPSGVLVMGSLNIEPAVPETDQDASGRGVTAELLRLVSPAFIVAEAVAYLRRSEHVERTHRTEPMTQKRERAYNRLHELRTVAAATPEEQIRSIAQRYCELVARGLTRPLPRLAAEFGLTREQARDRVRRARELDYLKPASRRGRAEGIPGPKLLRERPGLSKALAAMRREARKTKGGTNG
jgi:hypothetical protein